MAIQPRDRTAEEASLSLRPCDRADIDIVFGWVRDAQDAYRLAPRTPPPLTRDKMLNWRRPGREPLLLLDTAAEPVGYGELNKLESRAGEFWLGHLLVDPDRRGQGLGRELARLLLKRAFEQYDARRVSLVVFAGNQQAIACYRAAGMREDGHETHHFPAYHRRLRLLRMVATDCRER